MPEAPKPREVTLDGIAEALESTIAGLDLARAADLAELAVLREVKQQALGRERERLTAKLGADHPRLAALQRRAEVDATLVGELRVESARASVPPPKLDPKSWVLHGHVLTRDRKPVPGATLALYAGERWVEALGHARTDANGYFVLRIADATSPRSPALSLRVLQGGKPVHIVGEPVAVRAGTAEYREIVIGSPEDVGAPPESGSGPRPPIRAKGGGATAQRRRPRATGTPQPKS